MRRPPPRRSEEQEEWHAFVQQVVRELLLVAIEYDTPIAKRLWIEKFRPASRARTERRRARGALRRQRRAEKNAVTEAKVVEPTADLAAVAQEFKTDMTSSEAQARYLMALAAQRFADEQMSLIADAEIRADEGFQELEHALSELPPEQVVKMLQRFEANPALLAGDVLTGPGLILGVERTDGPLPLEGADSLDQSQRVITARRLVISPAALLVRARPRSVVGCRSRRCSLR
jgi:hypothetical protein